MGFTSGNAGSGVGDIAIMCLVCHYTDDDLRGDFQIRFLLHAWITILLGRITADRSNLVVGGIIGGIFLLPLP